VVSAMDAVVSFSKDRVAEASARREALVFVIETWPRPTTVPGARGVWIAMRTLITSPFGARFQSPCREW